VSDIFAKAAPDGALVVPGGVTVWLTGLSGAGKTTLAYRVGPALEAQGRPVEYLDGDVVRTHLSQGLGFSKADRDTQVTRLGWVASRMTRLGATVIVAAISPYAEARAKARAMVEPFGTFLEVHVKASVDACAQRDVKGLYARALKGEIRNFTGVDDPYEAPVAPELVIDTEKVSVEEASALLVERILEKSRSGDRSHRTVDTRTA
jgi:adenylyl-sulfate kinase